MKKCILGVRSTERDFDQNPALQAKCDTSIACITGAYSRGGYRSVTSLLMPWSTGPTTSALFCARKKITRIKDDKNRHLEKKCMHTSHHSVRNLLEWVIVVLIDQARIFASGFVKHDVL